MTSATMSHGGTTTGARISAARVAADTARTRASKLTVTLWVVQGLLAALYLFAGYMKLTLPIEAMTKQMPLPAGFLRFLGVAELLGALGLVLPGITRVKTWLTPLAASGLAVIMIGATAVSLTQSVTGAMVPAILALLCGFVVYGRWVREQLVTLARVRGQSPARAAA